ncbi:MAG TPA: ATP-binding protein [Gemmatimonadaceae bacterium]|jgi:two-component system sensor histidine kinase PilS (NtrC family)
MLDSRRIVRWAYIGRLSLSAAIFSAALFAWEIANPTNTRLAALMLIGSMIFTVGSAWFEMTRPERAGRAFFYLQTLFDLILVTATVHITGGASSPFAALYILVIAYASLVLPIGSGLLVAAFGNVLYIGDVVWSHGYEVGASVWLQLTIFALAALGTGVLAARMREAGAGDALKLEAQLERVRLQADDVLRTIRSGILTVEHNGDLAFANPAAGRMLGFEPAQAIGRPIRDLFGDKAPVLVQALERTIRDRIRISRWEATIAGESGPFPIGLNTTTIDADGTPEGISATAIFQDITDSKRLEELRLRAERLEGVAELSASLAHEIKNPLASIRSAVEQLARAPQTTDDARTLSALIIRESDRLSRLLSEFLDFARTRVTRIAEVELGDLVKGAVTLAATHPDGHKRVRVSCATPAQGIPVEGDEDLLHRAVFNIALNAVQAARDDGHVWVEVAAVPPEQLPVGVSFERGAASVRITDDGPGIPSEVRSRMFDPFVTTKPGGTGLGLPIVHRAIEAHRGLVFVDSGSSGTRFTVLLPRRQPKPEESP